MKIARYLNAQNEPAFAVLESDGTAREILGDIFTVWEVTDRVVEIPQILSPLDPRAILCIGLNYRKHAEETGAKIPAQPVLFMKTPSARQHPGAPIELPTHLASDKVDFEGELAVVIGRTCKNVSREHALDFVLGYTCANDVSARDWQKEREAASGAGAKLSTPSLPSARASSRPTASPTRTSSCSAPP